MRRRPPRPRLAGNPPARSGHWPHPGRSGNSGCRYLGKFRAGAAIPRSGHAQHQWHPATAVGQPSNQRARPRRARGGFGNIGMVLLLGGVLMMSLFSWRFAVAQERLRGEARHLAEIVAAEGYGMHHWLHQDRVAAAPAVTLPAVGSVRALTPAERRALASHSATASWQRDATNTERVLTPRQWRVVHLIGTPGGQLDTLNPIADGVVVIRPTDALVTAPTWSALNTALDIAFPPTDTLAAAFAATAVTGWDPDRDRAVLASQFSRLDADAVLRQRHAGVPLLPVQADLRLGGNDLTNVKRLTSARASIPALTGNCPPQGTPAATCAAEDLTLYTDALTVNGNLTVSGDTDVSGLTAGAVSLPNAVSTIPLWRTGNLILAGMLTSATRLTACSDADADICAGGDFDITAATGGAPNWTDAAIFADLVFRGTNELTGVRTVTAVGDSIFGTLGVGSLQVGCLRSVAPFIYGGGC